jgi:hypothetical protein
MALTASVRSQDEETVASGRPTVAPVVVPTIARILGNIPDGTPPPPAPVKPALVVPAKAILESKSHEQGGRTITIQRIKPIPMPPPPEPLLDAAVAPIDNVAFKQRLAEYRAAHPRTEMLSIGATVYRFNNSPPRTQVHYWPGSDGDCITFWSSADPSVLVPIQSLHDLYNSEFQRLKTAYDGRESSRLQHEAVLKANPPQPENITLSYWTTDEPAPVKATTK